MILIYSHIFSPRLQYTCSFIFKELMGVDMAITINSEEFRNYQGVKINYSDQPISGEEFRIQNHSLLFETGIREQSPQCFKTNRYTAFFKTENGDIPFDIFAASFYLVSRYEEWLPHEKDIYGRYAHENSLAFKEGFLDLPLINIWTMDLALRISRKFFHGADRTIFNYQYSLFNFKPSYDIDIAYSYRHKGLIRNAGGFLRSPSLERIKVLAGFANDPFDSYDWLHRLHEQYRLKPIYFFLVAARNGRYDKNILPHKDSMWRLVRAHAKKHSVGLHPSWQSGDNNALLTKEKKQLEAMSENKITSSRQHYIRFDLPAGYNRLIEAGITDDHSMGYGSINGFRASIASPFYWYNLEKEEQTVLRVHPFCFMDANSYYEQKQTAAETMEELMHYLSICKEVNGTLVTIWHNNFLGTSPEFKGWKEVYERFIPLARQ